MKLTDRVRLRWITGLIVLWIFLTGFIVRLVEFPDVLHYSGLFNLDQALNLFTYGKLISLILLASLLVFFFAASRCFALRFRHERVLAGLAICCLMLLLFSWAISPYRLISVWGFHQRTHGLLTYLALILVILLASRLPPFEETVRFVFYALMAHALVCFIMACLQFSGINPFEWEWMRRWILPAGWEGAGMHVNLTPFAASSIFPHFNYYGMSAALLYGPLTLFSVSAPVRMERIASCAISLVLPAGVFMSNSQGAGLAMLLTAIVLPFYVPRDTPMNRGVLLYALHATVLLLLFTCFPSTLIASEIRHLALRHPTAFLLGFAAVPVGFLLASLARQPRFNHALHAEKRIRWITRSAWILYLAAIVALVLHAGRNPRIFTNRGAVWSATWELICERPFWGHGPDTLYYGLKAYNARVEPRGGELFDKAHNVLIQTLYDVGFMPTLGLLALIVYTSGQLAKAARDGRGTGSRQLAIRSVLLLGISALVSGLVYDLHLAVFTVFIPLIAVSMGCTRIYRGVGTTDLCINPHPSNSFVSSGRGT